MSGKIKTFKQSKITIGITETEEHITIPKPKNNTIIFTGERGKGMSSSALRLAELSRSGDKQMNYKIFTKEEWLRLINETRRNETTM